MSDRMPERVQLYHVIARQCETSIFSPPYRDGDLDARYVRSDLYADALKEAASCDEQRAAYMEAGAQAIALLMLAHFHHADPSKGATALEPTCAKEPCAIQRALIAWQKAGRA